MSRLKSQTIRLKCSCKSQLHNLCAPISAYVALTLHATLHTPRYTIHPSHKSIITMSCMQLAENLNQVATPLFSICTVYIRNIYRCLSLLQLCCYGRKSSACKWPEISEWELDLQLSTKSRVIRCTYQVSKWRFESPSLAHNPLRR